MNCNKGQEAVINEIIDDLMKMAGDSPAESLKVIKRYVDCFPFEDDHNIAQHGNLLIYYCQVREMYIKHGYKANDISIASDEKLWAMYLKHVGFAVRKVLIIHGLWP